MIPRQQACKCAARTCHALAQERLENLKVFGGGANRVAELPKPGAGHRLWSLGVNSASGSLRSLRILMPLSLALNILGKADPRNLWRKRVLWSARSNGTMCCHMCTF